MPFLDPNVPFRKSADITKSLRSRDAPLRSLLATARELYSSQSTNIFFPRRNEWLLEWLAQRLKEDDGDAGRHARLSRECWDFLLEILQAVEPSAVAGILKRHGIVHLVARTVKEARISESDRKLLRISDDGQESTSSATERGSPCSPANDSTASLLEGISGVLVWLKQRGECESSIAATSRSTPEVCAGILGDFLAICVDLFARRETVDQVWVDSIVGLWKSSIWGSANSKKISAVWSEKCMNIAARLLVAPNTDTKLKSILESMVAEYIFAPEILFSTSQNKQAPKPSTKEIVPLLATLKQQDMDTEPSNSSPFLPALFRIAITSQSQGRNAKPDSSVVQVLFDALLTAIPHHLDIESSGKAVSATDANTIAALFQVLVDTGTALSSATLSRIVSNYAHLTSGSDDVRWSLVETALRIDFDTFLHPSVANLTSELFMALSEAALSDDVKRVMSLVVDGFVKARDVMGFVERWKALLKSSNNLGSIWRSDDLSRSFSNIVETALTSAQISKLATCLVEEQQWIIADSIFRGIRREETEMRLLTDGVFEVVVGIARQDKRDWKAWRLLVRIANMQSDMVLSLIDDALEIVKLHECWKRTIFASQVLMHIAEDHDDNTALDGIQFIINLAAQGLEKLKQWDGRIDSVDDMGTFGAAIALVLIGDHLGSLEKVTDDCREQFVDELLRAALASNTSSNSFVDARIVYQSMVSRQELYEFPALKDALIAGLISSLTPFSASAEDMQSAIVNTQPLEHLNSEPRFEFIISCLQSCPVGALRRQPRERLLDICLLMDISGYRFVQPLMKKLWRVCNAGSFMATDLGAIGKWAQVSGGSAILRQILRHTFPNRYQEIGEGYLKGLVKLSNALMRRAKKGESLSAGQLEMTWVIIVDFSRLQEDCPYRFVLEKTRILFLELLTNLLSDPKNSLDTGNILKYWREIWSLKRDDKTSALALVSKVIGRVVATQRQLQIQQLGADVLMESLGMACAVADEADEAMNATALGVVVTGLLDSGRRADALRHYKSMADRLDITTHRNVIRKIVDDMFSDIDDEIWGLFKNLVIAIQKPISPEELSISVDIFSYVHSRLILVLPSSRSPTALQSMAECIDILLREKPWAVIQHNLEATISSLTIALSARGPELDSADPDTLYQSLTRVLSSVMALHRHRIRGRHHLVVALLQQLLSCLFTPRIARCKTQYIPHPPWINRPLSLHSARAFGRCMQTFCDPPVSSVRSYRSDLTDSERSKERKLVAVAVGPVLECFVKKVLEERMDVDVRKEVGLAIDKVLEVLGRDGITRLSGRLTAEGRAVLKELWTDFGRNREMV